MTGRVALVWVMALFHRVFRGHWPDYELLEVKLKGRVHRQLECLACPRNPGPGGRQWVGVGL